MADVRIAQSFPSAPAHIGLRHSDDDADNGWTRHQAPSMLRAARIVLIDVHRMLVHTQQTHKSVVVFINGSSGPVPERLPTPKFFEISSVTHGLRSNSSIS